MRAGLTWDAVRVPRWVAAPTLAALADKSGAVIEDTWGAVWYWLIRPGAGAGWGHGHGVYVLGTACWLAVPPVTRTEGAGVHWLIPPVSGRAALTDAPLLNVALGDALAELAGPR